MSNIAVLPTLRQAGKQAGTVAGQSQSPMVKHWAGAHQVVDNILLAAHAQVRDVLRQVVRRAPGGPLAAAQEGLPGALAPPQVLQGQVRQPRALVGRPGLGAAVTCVRFAPPQSLTWEPSTAICADARPPESPPPAAAGQCLAQQAQLPCPFPEEAPTHLSHAAISLVKALQHSAMPLTSSQVALSAMPEMLRLALYEARTAKASQALHFVKRVTRAVLVSIPCTFQLAHCSTCRHTIGGAEEALQRLAALSVLQLSQAHNGVRALQRHRSRQRRPTKLMPEHSLACHKSLQHHSHHHAAAAPQARTLFRPLVRW